VQEGGDAMSEHGGETPEAVPARAKRAGDVQEPPGTIRDWAWTEPTVWTERMLAALETGVKGGKWYSLIDKVYSADTLQAAFAQVEANEGAAGVDHVSVDRYGRDLDANLRRLSEELRTGTYRPQAIRRHYIPKPGSREKRPLGIPTVRDRVVQTALRMVLEPIFERDFAAHSYGFRPGRGCKDALRRVEELLAAGYRHVVDADLKSYFDTIPKKPLLAMIGRKVTDGRILALIKGFLEQSVMEGAKEWVPEQGTPQGAVVAPRTQKITFRFGWGSVRRACWRPVDWADRQGDGVSNDDFVIANEDFLHEKPKDTLTFQHVKCIRRRSQPSEERRQRFGETQVGCAVG